MWVRYAVLFFLRLSTISFECEDSNASTSICEVFSVFPAASCSLFSELAEAFSFAQTLNSSTIRFTIAVKGAISVVQMKVTTEVEIVGMGNTLRFDQPILVDKGGHLTAGNATLSCGQTKSAFEVRGSLQLVNCTVAFWPRQTIQVYGGFVLIAKCVCSNNSEFIVAGKKYRGLVISESFFDSNSGIALIEDLEFGDNSTVLVVNNTFQRNRGNPVFALILTTIASTATTITMHNNFYHSCDSLLISAIFHSVSVSISSEKFTNNSAGGIELSQVGGSTVIARCAWIDNSFPFLYISVLQGEVVVTNSEFIGQRVAAPIQIANTGDAADCKVTIDSSLFHDYSISPRYQTAAAVNVYLCHAAISNTEMWNITDVKSEVQLTYALCMFQRSHGEMWNVQVENAEMSGTVIGFLESSGFVDNISVRHSTSGSNSILLAIGSIVDFRNVAISYCASSAEKNAFVPIFIEMSRMALSNVLISSNIKQLISGISVFYGEVECHNVTFLHLWGEAALIPIFAKFSAENIVCRNCTLNHYSEAFGKGSVQYRNIVIVDSMVKLEGFVGSPESSTDIQSVEITNSTAQALASCVSAALNIASVVLRGGHFQSLLGAVLFSRVYIQTVTSWQSIGSIVSISSASRISLAFSVFERIETAGSAITLQTSHLLIKQTEVRSADCAHLAKVFPQSTLELVDTFMTHMRSSMGELVQAQRAEVSIVNSTFSDYYGTLVDCGECVIEISGSEFRNGGFDEVRRTGAQSRKGGLLHCVDCLTISITRSQVFNISSDLGGALYCSAEASSNLTIFDCYFKNCSALRGGAVLAANVSVIVKNTDFRECNAEMQGGAMDLSIAKRLHRKIIHTRFVCNRAHEGGAVQWRGAPIEFTEVLFLNNSALYGPDTASYGVNISAVIPTAIAPGQSMSVSVELLDHYQQRVTTAELPMVKLVGCEGLSVSGITDSVLVEGTINFTNIFLLSSPASNQTLLAQIHIDNSDIFPNFINSSYTVTIRDCIVGEIKGTNNCSKCNPGYYSLSLNDTQCNLCPAIATCNGGNDIQPKIGAWFTGDLNNPAVECFNQDKCLGTVENMCEEGYTGLLCSKCASNWFPLATASCKQCPNEGVFVAESAVTIVFVLATLIGILRVSIIRPNRVALTCIRVLWTHAQYLAALSFIRTEYPTALQVLFRAMLDTASFYTATFPFACTGLNYLYSTFAGAFSGIIGILLSVIVIMYRCIRVKNLDPFHSELPTLLSFIIWATPISALYSSLQLFACTTVGDSDPLLVLDMTVKCWEGDHYHAVIAISIILIFIYVLIPTVAAAFTRRHASDHLNECRLRWTLLNLGCKVVALLAVLLQLPGSRLSQLFLGTLCLYFALLVNNYKGIYYETGSFVLVETSNIVLVTTYSLLFVLFQYNTAVSEVIITCVIYALNAGFFVFCCMYTRWRHRRYIRKEIYKATVYPSLGDSSGVALQCVHLQVA